ncbi:MAG TPA: hypothetical protein VLX11_07660 [Candidatus Acidoferrales bacterium]|nr:hypothetical protein [Candidatus Acidoferrales bacterium]
MSSADMRTREKIWVLLFAVTILLGAVIWILWGDDMDTLLQFRQLLFSRSLTFLRDGTLDRIDGARLLYGGMALVGFIMFCVLLKSVRGGEIRAFKERLIAAEVSKSELETLLQDAVWKEKHAQQGKEAALRDLQANMSTLSTVERQLSDTERLLRSRDSQLKALTARLDSLTHRPAENASVSLREKRELEDELRKQTALLQDKEWALKQLERDLTGQLQTARARLDAQDELLTERDKELETLRGQLAEQTAPHRIDNTLAEELNRAQQALKAKNSAVQEIERNLSAKLQLSEMEIREKQDLLQKRAAEIDALRADLERLTGQLTDIASAKDQSENTLQENLKEKDSALQAKDAALKELEGELAAKIRTLETQLREGEERLVRQSGDLEALQAEMATMAAKQTAIATAKEHLETALQREMDKQRQTALEKETALKELQEQYFNSVGALKAQLTEKDTLLQEHDVELEILHSKLNALAAAGTEKSEAEKLLQQEVRKQMQGLQAKDAAIKHLEELLSNQAQALQKQLFDKDKLLKERDSEMDSLRSKIGSLTETLSISERTESMLLNDLKKEQRALRAKESAMKEQEHSLNARLRALETELHDKQELLGARAGEIDTLKAESAKLTARLADVAAAVMRTENAHQQELKKKTEALESKDVALKELDEILTSRITALGTQLQEKESFLRERDAELDALRAQLTQTGSAKNDLENLLRQELNKTMEALQAKESTIRELEKSLGTTLTALENQVSEQDNLLQTRDGEIEQLRSEIAHLKSQAGKPDAAIERAESLLYEELSKENRAPTDESDENLTIAQALEIVLKEKEDLIKTRDAKIERLESELQEKRKELAKHEISVWQSVERRELWKHRLAKLGITLKD